MTSVLVVSAAPHLASGSSVDRIMLQVVVALIPTCGWAIYAFGSTALLGLAVACLSCVLFEHACCRLRRRPSTVADLSALITGLLFGLTLPPALPLWMVGVGGVVSIGLGKQLFGGLGYNCFNPALVGRACLQAAFPVAMTTWTPAFDPGRFQNLPSALFTAPFMKPTVAPPASAQVAVDGLSGATPLSAFKFEHHLTSPDALLFGLTDGSSGETSTLLILLGGLWLVAWRAMNFRITVAILTTVALSSTLLSAVFPAQCAPAAFMLLSGGLMLGATFMATDMVGSPMTNAGCWIYGVVVGILVVAIRVWGGMPEGVMYAILLGNATTPLLDRWITPRVFGTHRREAAS